MRMVSPPFGWIKLRPTFLHHLEPMSGKQFSHRSKDLEHILTSFGNLLSIQPRIGSLLYAYRDALLGVFCTCLLCFILQ